MTDDRPYEVLSPTKIRLGPEAKFWAREHGLSLAEMAKYLLAQDRINESESGAATPADFLPDAAPSEQIEDRRQDPEFVPDATMRQIWGSLANVPLQPRFDLFGATRSTAWGRRRRQPARASAAGYGPDSAAMARSVWNVLPE
jgi:hypothetical protein